MLDPNSGLRALALHACGSATDDVLVRATEPSMAAAFVVSPCCAGKICKSISDAALLGVYVASRKRTAR